MQTKLQRIADVAKEKPKEKFTSLIHLINEESLIQCHRDMGRRKAPGVDQMTKDKYEENLDENVRELVARMKTNSYKPYPALRKYIPKSGTDKKRPLGIPSYEDKLVQILTLFSQLFSALVKIDLFIISPIY